MKKRHQQKGSLRVNSLTLVQCYPRGTEQAQALNAIFDKQLTNSERISDVHHSRTTTEEGDKAAGRQPLSIPGVKVQEGDSKVCKEAGPQSGA